MKSLNSIIESAKVHKENKKINIELNKADMTLFIHCIECAQAYMDEHRIKKGEKFLYDLKNQLNEIRFS